MSRSFSFLKNTMGATKIVACTLFFFLLFARCQPEKTDTLFTSLPAEQTGLHFSNDLREDDRFNIIKYLYFYNGGGVAIGDVNNDELPDIFLTANQLPNRLFINQGEMKFEDATEKSGLLPTPNEEGNRWKTGVTMADVNADGWLDIYVCEIGFYKSVSGRNRLYINQKDGTFKEEAKRYGLDFQGFSQQAAFFDYDLDGDLDCFLLNHSTHSAESFSPAANRAKRDAQAGDRLFRNDSHLSSLEEGREVFTDVSEEMGIFGGPMGYGLGVVISDLNNDGWPDIYVTNDFHENDYLYLNSPVADENKNGHRFVEVISSTTGHTSTFSMGVDAADLNNDGLTDLMTLDMQPDSIFVERASAGVDHYNLQQMKLGQAYHWQFPQNCLQLAVDDVRLGSIGNETDDLRIGIEVHFQDIAQLAGVESTDWSWGTLLADLDNDGWKDIFVTNGIWRRPNDLDYLRFASDEEVQRNATDQEIAALMPSGKVSNYAFRNQSSTTNALSSIPTFENVSSEWGLDFHGCSNGSAYADLDNDGDLDLVVNNLNSPASIFQNNSSNNYLKIRLIGNQKNLFGIGAKVIVKSGGVEQTQELSPTRGWQSSSDHVLVFGLGQNEKVDEVKVVWPGDWSQTLTDVGINQTITFQAVDAVEKTEKNSEAQPFLFEIYAANSQELLPSKENRFTDFNIEPLMPWMLSTQGPCMDWGSFENGEAWVYHGGAKGQAGQLFTKKLNGDFINSQFLETKSQPAFEKDFLCEDVSSAFFDADNDGDLDLYVVSGGGEYREGSAQLRDRFYENMGDLNFEKREDALPNLATNGSFVLPFDFDGDMDLDLFVGSRSVPGNYGLAPKSFILKNDSEKAGQIRFVDVTEKVFPALSELGMVTSAAWLQEEKKLVIVGEWMELQVVDFSKSKVENPQSLIPNSHGLWQTIEAADFDGDGDLDLLCGNMGLNTPLTASPEEPLELYIKDFDENGATDPIVTWYQEGEKYPLVTKDALDKQLPQLKKKYLSYRAFAAATFEDIFDKKMLENSTHLEVTELRSMYFENIGDGKFEARPLPLAAQTSPIYSFLVDDFDKDGNLDALTVGNFHGFRPDLGKADASFGYFLKGDGKGNFTILDAGESGFFVPGEGKDILHVKSDDGAFIVVGRNGEGPLFFHKK